MDAILQDRPAVAPWAAPRMLRLPGTEALDPAAWLTRDVAFAGQMALRDRLIAEREREVHALLPGAGHAAAELRDLVLDHLARAPGYARAGAAMRRPDSVAVPLDDPPLVVAGRLVQEDLCLLDRPEGAAEHVLVGAILCFPSNWTLAQKLGRGLLRIHAPVERYDPEMARRVQRMLDNLRPEAPVMRANLLIHDGFALHNPKVEGEKHYAAPGAGRYVRVERQVLLRLPRTRAIVFSIHTSNVAAASLGPEDRAALEAARPGALAPA